MLPPKNEYVIPTSEFDDVKARLARIENKRRLRDGQNEKKPSLRRRMIRTGRMARTRMTTGLLCTGATTNYCVGTTVTIDGRTMTVRPRCFMGWRG
jgi:hypothetical protein